MFSLKNQRIYLHKQLFFLFFLFSFFFSFSFADLPNDNYEHTYLSPERSLFKKKKRTSKIAYKYDLAACIIFRNEASWLREWIEYHHLLGVQHFYLYNHLSTDNYKDVLAPYIENGLVELFDIPFEADNVETWTAIQSHAYICALHAAKGVSKWLAILDSDEYIVPTYENSILDVLKDYEQHGALVINWQMFGTSNVEKIPHDKLMIETLLTKANDNYAENAFVKSIVRPERVSNIKDPHKVVLKKKYLSVNSHGFPVTNSTSPFIVIDRIRINHYWTRDEDYFNNNKCPRRQGWSEGFTGQLLRKSFLNDVIDTTILRFVPLLRQRMGLGFD